MPNDLPTASPAVPQTNAFAKFAAQKPVEQSTPQVPVLTIPTSSIAPAQAPPVMPVQPANNVTVQVTPAAPAKPEIVVPTAQPSTPAQAAAPIKIELNISTAPAPTIETKPIIQEAEIVQAAPVAVASTQSAPAITAQATPAAQAPVKKDSFIKKLLHWGVFVSLMGVGIKGFFDCLYFITVEFQNFETGLEKHLIETTLVSQLILKASLLVFATALSIFFGLQLSRRGGNKWLTIFSSIAVFTLSLFILQYAGTINVVDVFKAPSANL